MVILETYQPEQKYYLSQNGQMPLVSVAKSGNFAHVTSLLEEFDHDVAACRVTLRAASYKGHSKIVEYLDDWDKNGVLEWDFALRGLITSGQLDLVKRVIFKRYAQLNVEDSFEELKSLASLNRRIDIRGYLESLERDWLDNRKIIFLRL